MQKILVIQTASLGDVIIATALIEKLHACYPAAELDMLVQQSAASLLHGHPLLHQVLVWQKKTNKYRHLCQLSREIRRNRYDLVVNVQRFAATGWLCWRSKARQIAGFDKNPFSFCYTHKIPHEISSESYLYEADRNQRLIAAFTDDRTAPSRLYPTEEDEMTVRRFREEQLHDHTGNPSGKTTDAGRGQATDAGRGQAPYLCIFPASLWFTKQYPKEKWVELIRHFPDNYHICLLGSPNDRTLCEEIKLACTDSEAQAGNTDAEALAANDAREAQAEPGSIHNKRQIHNLAGRFSLLQSAALMRGAAMNYTNDSAPLHIAVAVGAKVTAIFCSTVKSFGFAPVGENIHIVETAEPLPCRPCGIHGHPQCPEGHFRCGYGIDTNELLKHIPNEYQ